MTSEESHDQKVINTPEEILFKPVELVPKTITMAEIAEQTDKATVERSDTLIANNEEFKVFIYNVYKKL